MSEPDASASVQICPTCGRYVEEHLGHELDKARAERDRLARELALADSGIDILMRRAANEKQRAEIAEADAEIAEAELARAQTALRDIASCRTRPPADAIEIACRYWADASHRK